MAPVISIYILTHWFQSPDHKMVYYFSLSLHLRVLNPKTTLFWSHFFWSYFANILAAMVDCLLAQFSFDLIQVQLDTQMPLETPPWEAVNCNWVSLPIILEVEDCDSKVKSLKERHLFPYTQFFPTGEMQVSAVNWWEKACPASFSAGKTHNRIAKEDHSVLNLGLLYMVTHIISIGGKNLGMVFFILLISFSAHLSELSLMNSRGCPQGLSSGLSFLRYPHSRSSPLTTSLSSRSQPSVLWVPLK